MKAITIWQPWASLIALGEKKYETRSWPTKYRGKIAIHAAAKELKDLPEEIRAIIKDKDLPLGAIVATADLVNVWHIVYNPGADVDAAAKIDIGAESMSTNKHAPDFDDYIVPTEKEMQLGDWTPGRYAWELDNVRILPEPIPAKGKQGLWNIADELVNVTAETEEK